MGISGISGWEMLVILLGMLIVVLPLIALAAWGLWFIIKRAVLTALRDWDRERSAGTQGG